MRLLHSLRCSLRSAGLAALALTCSSLAFGQEHLKLADGTTLTGNAVKYDDAMKVVTFKTDDGRELLLRIDELDQRSAYMLAKSRVDSKDAAQELRMANFARDIGLYAHAARHYRQALALDPALKPDIDKDAAKCRTMAAAWCMGQAKSAAARGDTKEAERWLKVLLDKLPNEPEAKEATELLDAYYTKNREAADDHIEAQDQDLLKTDLKRGKDSYDRMLAKDKEGLMASPASSKAISAWESAIKEGERALYEIQQVEKKKTDPKTLELTASYRKVVNDQIIEVYTNMASAQTTRSSYQQAMASVNKALAIDPQNSSAISMRGRVETAAAQSGGRVWW